MTVEVGDPVTALLFDRCLGHGWAVSDQPLTKTRLVVHPGAENLELQGWWTPDEVGAAMLEWLARVHPTPLHEREEARRAALGLSLLEVV